MPLKPPMRLLWIGQVFNPDQAIALRAVSLAANRWQRGLLGALQESGHQIDLLGHRPEQLWPCGEIYLKGLQEHVLLSNRGEGCSQTLVPYWNIPAYRIASLANHYQRAIRLYLNNHPRPDCILSYNVSPFTTAVARDAIRVGIPWVPVIADVSGGDNGYSRLRQQVSTAAGCVFLSWTSFMQWNGASKLHLDGGMEKAPDAELEIPSATEPKSILYAGVLNQFGGIEQLLNAFALIKDAHVRLLICGKGHNSELQKRLESDKRIQFLGCVPEIRLQEIASKAWVMVNPRPGYVSGNEHNFPSKLLDYLAHGKPVVSTITPGLAPDYRDLVVPVDRNSPQALAGGIEMVLKESAIERAKRCQRICQFLQMQKTWKNQSERLLEWLCIAIAQHIPKVS